MGSHQQLERQGRVYVHRAWRQKSIELRRGPACYGGVRSGWGVLLPPRPTKSPHCKDWRELSPWCVAPRLGLVGRREAIGNGQGAVATAIFCGSRCAAAGASSSITSIELVRCDKCRGASTIGA